MKLLGLDHADIRVPSIVAVESFYDAILPALGLPHKTESHVNHDGDWCEVDAVHPRNAIEYSTPLEPGSAGWFVGFIEDRGTTPTPTRIAFALKDEADLPPIELLLKNAGGRIIEWTDDDTYPAFIF